MYPDTDLCVMLVNVNVMEVCAVVFEFVDMYFSYTNTVYFVFKYKIQDTLEVISNTEYISHISNTYLKYLYLEYFTTLPPFCYNAGL